MSENQENEQKFYETLKYLGRELVKEGEGKKGHWKLFKLRFDVGGDFPKRFSIFDSAFKDKEGNVKLTLEEGKYYVVGYTINEFQSQHGPKKGRNAFFIKEASEEEVADSKKEMVAPTPMAAEKRLPTSEELNAFLAEYKTHTEEDEKFEWTTFTQTWFANNHEQEYDVVKAFAKEEGDGE